MTATASVTFACEEPVRLAAFRRAEIDAAVEAGTWAVLQRPDAVGPRLIFHRRPKSATVHIPIQLGATVAERKGDPETNAFCVE